MRNPIQGAREFGRGASRGLRQRGLGVIQTALQKALDSGMITEDTEIYDGLTAKDLRAGGFDVSNQLRSEGEGTGVGGFLGEIAGDPLTYLPMGKVAKVPAFLGKLAGVGALSGYTQDKASENEDPESQALTTGALTALTGGLMRGAPALYNKVAPQSDPELIKRMLERGVPVSPSSVMGGNVLPRIESLLAQAPITGSRLRALRRTGSTKLNEMLGDIGESLSPISGTSDEIGETLNKESGAVVKKLRGEIGDMYDQFFKQVPKDVVFKPKATLEAYNNLTKEFGDDPEILGVLESGVFNQLQKAKHPQDWKFLRKRFESKAQQLANKGFSYEAGKVRELSDVLDSEIGETAAKAIPEGETLLKKLNSEAQTRYGLINDFKKFLSYDQYNKSQLSNEQLLARFLNTANAPTARGAKSANAKLLSKMQENLPPEVMDSLTKFKLQSMGIKPQSMADEFDPSKFVREWDSLSDEAKDIMFRRRLAPEQMSLIDDLAQYSRGFRGSLNPSGTAASVGELGATATGVGLALAGGLPVSALLIPPALYYGSSSQKLAKVLNSLPREVLTSPKSAENIARISKALSTSDLFTNTDYENLRPDLSAAGIEFEPPAPPMGDLNELLTPDQAPMDMRVLPKPALSIPIEEALPKNPPNDDLRSILGI